MSLIGKYECKEIGATLEITEANNSNGQGNGVFSYGEVKNCKVSLHYHFENNTGKNMNLNIWGCSDDPNRYIGCAGYMANHASAVEMDVAGGIATIGNASSFSGKFVRV